jgi:predicted ATPase
MNGDQNRVLHEAHGMLQELRSVLVHNTIQSRIEPGKYNAPVFLAAIHGDMWEKFTALNKRLDTLEAALAKKTP